MMKITKGRIIGASILIVLFLVFLLLSTAVKYWINKNSKELLGRKLELTELHFNYAKVAVRVVGFKLYEQNDKDLFVAFNELYVNVSPWNLLAGEYSVSEIYLDGLDIAVIQNELGFNFDDLIEEQEVEVDSSAVQNNEHVLKFAIHDIEFKNGQLRYKDTDKDNKIDLNDINLALPLIAWNNEKSEMGVNFLMGNDGSVSISADVDHATERYSVDLGVSDIDVSPFVVYLKEYMKVNTLKGKVNTQLHVDGSMSNFTDVIIDGIVKLKDFELTDEKDKRFVAAKTAIVNLDSINLGSSHYEIVSVELDSLELYAALNTDKSNVETIFEPLMISDTLVVDSIVVEEESTALYYQIDTLILSNGFVEFEDNTLNRKFVYSLSDIDVEIGEITEKATSVPVNYSMNLNGSGNALGKLHFSLMDYFDFDFAGKVKQLDLMSFSPYTEYYIARPITQGKFNYSCSIDMTSIQLTNQNNLRISEFEFGDKTKDPNAIKAPVRLALYLLKDQNDIIAFDLPVSGNPQDPKFGVSKIIWKTLMNFLVKTATKPFGMLGSLAGTNPDNIKSLPFNYLDIQVNEIQKERLRQIAKITEKKTELKFTFTQETNPEEERNLFAIQECANRFYKNNVQSEISMKADELFNWARNNTEFHSFIYKVPIAINQDSIVPLCVKMIGEQELDKLFAKQLEDRNLNLQNYMKDSLLLPVDCFEVSTSDLKNISEQQKQTNYRVEVSLK